MLRLASDADVHGDILHGLHRRMPEIDLVRVQDALPEQTPDPEVLAWAAAENRVLITNDRNTMVGFAYQRVAAAVTLLAVLLLGAGKGYIRSLVARELFATEIGSRASCYWLLSPLVPWIMLGNFIVAGFARRIEWRGTEYELVSRDKVRVRGRSGG